MSEFIYGSNPVFEALRSEQKIETLWIAADSQDAVIMKITSLAKQKHIPVHRVPSKKLLEMTHNKKNQGVVAVIANSQYSTVDAILARSKELNEPPLIVMLDGIEDPHNLGAVLRTADGAGFHGLILRKRRSAGLTDTVAKTSAGASAHVLTAQVANLNFAIDKLKQLDIWIVGADQNTEKIYYDADLTGPLCIVIGSEGQGLSRLVREKCDFLVKIPMYGKINSLNASVAASLLFFEARRQRLYM